MPLTALRISLMLYLWRVVRLYTLLLDNLLILMLYPANYIINDERYRKELESMNTNIENKVNEEIRKFERNFEALESQYTYISIDGKEDRKDADYIIDRFLTYVEEINNLAEEQDTNWAWCVDDSFGYRYFNPWWIVFANGRIYSIFGNGLTENAPGFNGKDRKRRRYRIENTYIRHYINNGSRVICQYSILIANYFIPKPAALFEKYDENEIEVGHYYSFNPNKPHYANDYATNHSWQTKIENASITELIRHGNWKKAFEKLDKKEGVTNILADDLKPLFNNARFTPNNETGAEYCIGLDGRPQIRLTVNLSPGVFTNEDGELIS